MGSLAYGLKVQGGLQQTVVGIKSIAGM